MPMYRKTVPCISEFLPSRNTEGSGLGLAIAKSFTTLQGGELTVDVDGDLFKVTTSWPVENKITDNKINQ